jgi:hypothetical protein
MVCSGTKSYYWKNRSWLVGKDLPIGETALLTEFLKWASPVELRQRSHSAAVRAFDVELETVSESDRVLMADWRHPWSA